MNPWRSGIIVGRVVSSRGIIMRWRRGWLLDGRRVVMMRDESTDEYEVLCANCDEKVPTEDAARVHIIDFEVWELARELCSSCQAEMTVMEVKDLADR